MEDVRNSVQFLCKEKKKVMIWNALKWNRKIKKNVNRAIMAAMDEYVAKAREGKRWNA